MPSHIDVVVVGSCNVDLVCRVERPPNAGETVTGTGFSTYKGGKGGNVCVIAARCGAKCSIAGKVGSDTIGVAYRQSLQDNDIDTSYLTVDPDNATGTAMIVVDAQGENQIIVCAGANGAFNKNDVIACTSIIQECKVLVCQLEIPYPSSILAAQIARDSSTFVIFNPSPLESNTDLKAFFQFVDCLVVNHLEASMLTHMDKDHDDMVLQAKTMARMMHSCGPVHVIITMGEMGAMYSRKLSGRDTPETTVFEANAVDHVVDTTGAGDAFLGVVAAMASSRLRHTPEKNGLDLTEAVKRAGQIAAITVTKEGAQPSYPSASYLKENKLSIP
eukprot:CFRG0456T1